MIKFKIRWTLALNTGNLNQQNAADSEQRQQKTVLTFDGALCGCVMEKKVVDTIPTKSLLIGPH